MLLKSQGPVFSEEPIHSVIFSLQGINRRKEKCIVTLFRIMLQPK
jgi:hypothetical protein